MPTKWMSTRLKPIANPAKLPAPFFASVVPKTTSTNTKVNTTSTNTPLATPMLQALAPVAVPTAGIVAVVTIAYKTADAKTAPITCATM